MELQSVMDFFQSLLVLNYCKFQIKDSHWSNNHRQEFNRLKMY